MDYNLKEELIQAMFRFRKVAMSINHATGSNSLHMGEAFVLGKIADQTFDANLVAQLQCELHVTKAAISQMLNGLESKGYITREIDKNDRRKFVATITPKGREVARCIAQHADGTINEILSRFGQQNTQQLITLFHGFADVIESVMRDAAMQQCKVEGLEGEICF